jgi:branched-chain amino acid aminotransferase
MKAFRMADGRINIFRLAKHYERFSRSLRRMCMPPVPEEIFTQGLVQLVELDKDWVPSRPGSALYIRPFMYASEAKMGVKVSDEYRFIVFTGPVPPLYSQPMAVKVETEYIRAAKGGTGFAKCGGNYGGAFYPTQKARKQGYEQVIWTGGKDNRFLEESGMMNMMFAINKVLVTPPLSDTILDGVTRDSLLTLAQAIGIKTEERPISIDELKEAFANRTVTEAFGAGTAAVVAPIQTICIEGTDYDLPVYNEKSILNILKHNLELIRNGRQEDHEKWNYIV